MTGSRHTSFSLSITRDPPQAIRFLGREIQLYHLSSANKLFLSFYTPWFLWCLHSIRWQKCGGAGPTTLLFQRGCPGRRRFYAVFAGEVCGNDDGEIRCFVVEVVDTLRINCKSIVLPKCKGDLSAWPNCVPMRVC
jgi:hypothetical protein